MSIITQTKQINIHNKVDVFFCYDLWLVWVSIKENTWQRNNRKRKKKRFFDFSWFYADEKVVALRILQFLFSKIKEAPKKARALFKKMATLG